jgi:hypothetical protein
MSTQVDHAKDQARLQYESIAEMITAYRQAEGDAQDAALQRIQEDPLSVQVRCPWQSVGEECVKPDQYNILLCPGGPAVRIIGTLSEYLEPDSARIQYQDWGTPWTDYPLISEQIAVVLEYAQHFYYGE